MGWIPLKDEWKKMFAFIANCRFADKGNRILTDEKSNGEEL